MPVYLQLLLLGAMAGHAAAAGLRGRLLQGQDPIDESKTPDMCPSTAADGTARTVRDARDACMMLNGSATAQWQFDDNTCECEQYTAEPMCPFTATDATPRTVHDARDACMKRNGSAAAAQWQFDDNTCECQDASTALCCKAMTAPCLACVAGKSEAEFCAENPHTAGCVAQPEPWPMCPDQERSVQQAAQDCLRRPGHTFTPTTCTCDEVGGSKKQTREEKQAKRVKAQAKRAARQAAKELMQRLAAEGAAGLHHAADTDGSGTLDFEEFAAVLGSMI